MSKRALVTGHTGFVGRHISRALSERGYWVDGVDIDDSVFIHPGRTYEMDFNFWHSNTIYDLVVHCAYAVGGRAAIDGVNMNLATNLALDAHLFKWALETKQRAVMYFSSSAAYPAHLQKKYCGNCDDAFGWCGPYELYEDAIDFDDDHLGPPDADYGLAKICGERMARAASNNGLRVHVLRPFSGYGEDQHLDYPFPSIVARAKDGDFTVWGPRGQSRDWIHISDVVEGALRVYENDERRPVNLCTGIGTEMGELMKMASIANQKRLRVNPSDPLINYKVEYDESKPTGVFYRVGDSSRMNEHYTAKISLEEGIERALRR